MDIVWAEIKSLDPVGINVLCACLLVMIAVLAMVLKVFFHPYGSFSTSVLRPFVANILTSNWFGKLTNFRIGVVRRLTGQLTLNCFVACDCPHSYALLQALRYLIHANRLPVRVKIYVLPLQSISSSTAVGNHMKWYLFDARLFCTLYSDYKLMPPTNHSVMSFFSEPVMAGEEDQQHERAVKEDWYQCMEAVTTRLLELQLKGQHVSDSDGDTSPLDRYICLLQLIWDENQYGSRKKELLVERGGDADAASVSLPEQTQVQCKSLLESNAWLLERLGYYGSGLVEYKGSWYSCSRLHHLERLEFQQYHQQQQQQQQQPSVLFGREVDGYWHNSSSEERHANFSKFKTPPQLLATTKEETSSEACARGDCIELFYSFRSPYSQLVLDRALFLCLKYNKKLVLRPMLPMIARKLAVPPSKVMYIAGDANREAKLWNFTFGCISDPSHSQLKPVYRALAVYLLAMRTGPGLHAAFVKAFGFYVWGRGVDAGTDMGMKIISESAGLEWKAVQSALRPEAMAEAESEWRRMTTANAEVLGAHGLWGVPALKFKDECLVWGQDKLWVLDQYLAYDCSSCSSGSSGGMITGGAADTDDGFIDAPDAPESNSTQSRNSNSGSDCGSNSSNGRRKRGGCKYNAAIIKIIQESGH